MADRKRQEVTRLLKRGLNHYGLGDLEAAIASWEKAKTLDPQNRAAHDYLETAYEESGLLRKTDAEPPVAPPSSSPAAVEALSAFDDDDTPRTNSPPPLPDGARLPPLPLSEEDRPDTLVADALDAYKAGRLDDAWTVLSKVAEE